jgi:polyisoprenyl-teichoic acid--peptidoglycan teichoic acid transferase
MMDDIKRPIVVSHSRPAKSEPSPAPKLQVAGRRPRRRGLKMVLGGIIVAIVLMGGFLVLRAANLSGKIFVGQSSSFFDKLSAVVRSEIGGTRLVGEGNGQINVLLLGIGGSGHDGPFLSDTIILAQIRPKDNKVTLISIPRDYQVNLGSAGYRKINDAFSQGYLKNKDWNQGGQEARKAAGQVSGLDIPYFAVVDFQGFEKAVDLVGGVDVSVDRTFTDYSYPNSTDGYLPAVTFTQGSEHMNGARALIFARSRHAAGPEGSDFARSQRQQKIINAFKAKAVDLNLITDAGKINSLLSVIGGHVHTNLDPGEMLRLYNLTKDYTKDNIASLSLDPTTGIICPQILETNGAYVLTLCPGKTAQDLKNFFKDSFTTGKLGEEQSVIWLADSTAKQTLYNKAAKQLETAGLTVYQISYKGTALQQNVVYQVNDKPATLTFIKNNLNASEVTLPPPGVKLDPAKVDAIVILGSDTIPDVQSDVGQ